MGINVEVLNIKIKTDLLENHSLEEISAMNLDEAFDKWLEYQGIIGYGYTIRHALFELATCSTRVLETTDRAKEEYIQDYYFGFGG